MTLKNLKNGKRALLLEDLKSINGFIWPKGTKIEMENCLAVTAIIRTKKVEIEGLDFPLYFRSVVKSEAMHTLIESDD